MAAKKAPAKKAPAKKAPAKKAAIGPGARAPGERRYWLMKTEPDVFSFDDLMKAPKRTTFWDGVRNYQARNFMRDEMRVGDGVLVYRMPVLRPYPSYPRLRKPHKPRMFVSYRSNPVPEKSPRLSL